MNSINTMRDNVIQKILFYRQTPKNTWAQQYDELNENSNQVLVYLLEQSILKSIFDKPNSVEHSFPIIDFLIKEYPDQYDNELMQVKLEIARDSYAKER